MENKHGDVMQSLKRVGSSDEGAKQYGEEQIIFRSNQSDKQFRELL